MRLSSFWCLVVALGAGTVCHAQQSPAQEPRPAPSTPAPSTPAPAAPVAEPPVAPSAEPSPLQPTEPAAPSEFPAAEPSAAEGAPPSGAPPTEASAEPPPSAAGSTALGPGSDAIPSPGELGDRLVGDLSPETQVKPTWTAPAPVLTLHGYLRVRGELMDSYWLGRAPHEILVRSEGGRYASLNLGGLGPDPFSRFRPLERSKENTVCADEDVRNEPSLGNVAACDVGALSGANLRFRLSPQLNISEDVRIKATFDVLDNVVLGSAPQSYYGAGRSGDGVFVGTDDLATGLGQMIVARRAWAEVRNRDLGELRFGIMPEHWGLGMLYNAGNRLDDDFSTDVGRVMATTKVAGFYLSAAYDFFAEGMTKTGGEYRPAYDSSQIDDVDQFTFSVVRRVPDEDEASVLERGDLLLNGGIHFQMRSQDARYQDDPNGPGDNSDGFVEMDASLYTPDIWAQLRWGGLRLELEAAGVFGSIDNDNRQYDILEFGVAFESELRLLDDKLGIYLYSGVATGDSDVEGLSSFTDYVSQLEHNDGNVSTFRFHPSYRVDQILWRNIMRQVTGAYYFRPGVSYDFVKDDFGQLFGARLDVIWSRATNVLQTPGNDADLGVELDAQIYWRSDDGPDKDDGYHAALQYSVLFPMDGLGYYHRSTDLDTAQSLRLVLGVAY